MNYEKSIARIWRIDLIRAEYNQLIAPDGFVRIRKNRIQMAEHGDLILACLKVSPEIKVTSVVKKSFFPWLFVLRVKK
jgi:hypothetical protein